MVRPLHAFFFVIWFASAVEILLGQLAPATASLMPMAMGDGPLVRTRRPLPYAPWLHGHIVQLHWSQQSDAKVIRDVSSLLARNVSVAAVVLDVYWWDPDDLFAFDPSRFAEGGRVVVEWLHARGIRVVVWWSPLVPLSSKAYVPLLASKSFLLDGRTDKVFVGSWAHADAVAIEGSLLDYGNEAARAWAHAGLGRLLLGLGVDAIRNGGVDSLLIGRDALGTEGYVTKEGYSNAYYWDTFDYGRKVKGFEFATMSKGVDTYGRYHFSVFAPRDVSFMHFVGEHRGTDEGFQSGLMNLFHSAKRRYVNPGTLVCGTFFAARIGCVSDGDLFERWVAFAGYGPLLITPGMDGMPTSAVAYLRAAIAAHTSLGLYFTSVATDAFYDHESSMRAAVAAEVVFALPDQWEVFVGDALLLSPEITSGHDAVMPQTPFPSYLPFRMSHSAVPYVAGRVYPRARGGNDAVVGYGAILPLLGVDGRAVMRTYGVGRNASRQVTAPGYAFRVSYVSEGGGVVVVTVAVEAGGGRDVLLEVWREGPPAVSGVVGGPQGTSTFAAADSEAEIMRGCSICMWRSSAPSERWSRTLLSVRSREGPPTVITVRF